MKKQFAALLVSFALMVPCALGEGCDTCNEDATMVRINTPAFDKLKLETTVIFVLKDLFDAIEWISVERVEPHEFSHGTFVLIPFRGWNVVEDTAISSEYFTLYFCVEGETRWQASRFIIGDDERQGPLVQARSLIESAFREDE